MSLEQKIKSLLTERAVLPTGTPPGDQTEVNAGSSQDPKFGQLDQFNSGASAAAPVKQATLPISNQGSGDQKPVNAGSSQDAPSQSLDANNSGASAAAPVSQTTLPISNTGSGDVEALNKGEYALSSVLPTPGQGGVSEETKAALKADVASLFEGQEGLAEGFVDKAASLFEAAVVARVTAEVDKAHEALVEAAEAQLVAAKAKLAEDVDAYMSYVVEAWMKDNKLSVDSGLRTEITESFMMGLKDLFVENYIEVPEDKVNVVESLSAEVDKTKSRLNEEIEKSIALSDKIVELEKAAVLEAAAKGLAVTDAERLAKLTEGVEFDSKEMFAEKVAVIKEAHFKTAPKKSAETLLAEQAGQGNETKEVHSSIQRVVAALNRGTRF